MKKRKKYKRLKKIGLSLCVFIIIVISSIFGVLNTSLFEVKDISVYGNDNISKDDLLSKSDIEYNKNIFAYNLKDIEKKLKSHPYVENLEVKRKFPNKIYINLKEKKELFILNTSSDYVYLDQNCKVIKIDDDLTNKNIPIANNIEVSYYNLGQTLKLTNQKLDKEFKAIISKLYESGIYRQIKSINYEEKFTLRTKNGIDIKFAYTDELENKFKILSGALVDLQTKKVNSGILELGQGDYAIYKKNVQ